MNPNILDDHPPVIDENEQVLFVQIDEDEDQGFGAQFNDDCPSSDDENNHRSTLSLSNKQENDWLDSKKKRLERSQSDSDLYPNRYERFLSLPNVSSQSPDQYEKIEHFIIDDQQPVTTASNLMIKKKQQEEEKDGLSLRKKKGWRKSSEEILEISNQESTSQVTMLRSNLFSSNKSFL